MAARHSVVDVDSVEHAGPGGGVRFLRPAVGATAFGSNGLTFVTIGAPRDEPYLARRPF